MQSKRGVLLTIFAILFIVLAISNFSKPLGRGGAGFVFLGTKTSGVPNMILGPLFGLYLAIYAIGIWRMKKYALPMGAAYAVYVILNLILFSVKNPGGGGAPSPVFMLGYIIIAIGVSSGTPIVLWRRRAELS